MRYLTWLAEEEISKTEKNLMEENTKQRSTDKWVYLCLIYIHKLFGFPANIMHKKL